MKSFPRVIAAVAASVLAFSGCESTGPAGAEGPQGPQGPQGIQGVPGAPGPSGSLRIYGDGSAGPLDIVSDTDWAADLPSNLQFTSVTIASGVTLEVPSGIVIRVAGTFTNEGTIEVEFGTLGGLGSSRFIPADPGVSLRAAQNPAVGAKDSARYGGLAGPRRARSCSCACANTPSRTRTITRQRTRTRTNG